MLYWHSIKTIFFTLFLSPLTEQHPRRPACSSLFHSWVNPLIFSLPLVLFSSCSLSSSPKIMWSVWSFCSTVRRVNQSEGISIRLWAIFSKKPVKPCLHCRRSNHAFTAADSELHHLFADFLCRHRDSKILVGTHWSDMTMWWTSASLINLRSRNRGGSTFETHWSDEAMNDVMNECFVRAKILRFVRWWFRFVRERESCSEGES